VRFPNGVSGYRRADRNPSVSLLTSTEPPGQPCVSHPRPRAGLGHPVLTAAALQLSQNLRTFLSMFDSLRADHTGNINITLAKTSKTGERVKLQIRAESHNLCNKALFWAR
jgi:hypothetical protein